jgi:hypothetical protein
MGERATRVPTGLGAENEAAPRLAPWSEYRTVHTESAGDASGVLPSRISTPAYAGRLPSRGRQPVAVSDALLSASTCPPGSGLRGVISTSSKSLPALQAVGMETRVVAAELSDKEVLRNLFQLGLAGLCTTSYALSGSRVGSLRQGCFSDTSRSVVL